MQAIRSGVLAALLMTTWAPAEAVVIQSVLTIIEQPNGAKSTDFDEIEGLDQDDIDRDVLARTILPAHQAIASAGVFGAVGLEALAFQAGEVLARTDIEATFFNDTGRPARAVSQFIVDGGSLSLLAAAGAKAALAIRVSATTGNSQLDVFHGRVEVEAIQDFGAFVVNNVEDDFIQTRFDPTAAIPTVLVDPFLQELDLGVLGANEELKITYGALLFIDALARDVEVAHLTFSDPLSANIAPPTFTPVDLAAVPLPPAGLALIGAFALLGLAARRRSIKRTRRMRA